MAEVAFQDSIAPRVWYRDSTLRWGTYGGQAGLQRRNDLLVEYFDNAPWPAAVVEPRALEAFEHGAFAIQHVDLARADSLFAVAEANHVPRGGSFLAATVANRARIALAQGNHARADSLAMKSIEFNDRDPDTWAFAAAVAYIRHDRERAVNDLRQCFGFNPNNAEGRRVAETLGIKMP
jgi:tetratricopeptide (TPR) repeat protein